MSSSILSIWHTLPENEKTIVDYLRQLVLKTLPSNCREKLAYGVPYYYLRKRICMIWPASIKGGGIKSGVLFGFCRGNQLHDPDGYLVHGTNKIVFYRIYNSLEEIDEKALIKLLLHAIEIDSHATSIPAPPSNS